ncbi:Nn.00g030210.m01.CDS01 [Neocucurbitaria sp. VM-36]
MPTDVHGQTHAGSFGLFDDDAEHNDAIARAERHEHERLEGLIRRQERREKRRFRKDEKVAGRSNAAHTKSKLPRSMSWLGKLFGGGGGRDLSLEAATARSVAAATDSADEGRVEGENSRKGKLPERQMSEYVIVRKPETPEPVYTGEDVDATDSPWLRACGMVRVKSDDPGGCHIVPKSVIQKNE